MPTATFIVASSSCAGRKSGAAEFLPWPPSVVAGKKGERGDIFRGCQPKFELLSRVAGRGRPEGTPFYANQ